MKYFFSHVPDIEYRIKHAREVLLMLDFDGTLSPLAPTPQEAILPMHMKRQLQQCAKLFSVAIVSGRSLADIRKKVGIKGLLYAGNHGLEWQIGKKRSYMTQAQYAVKPLFAIAQELKPVRRVYPGVVLEYKKFSLAIHYRRVTPLLVARCKKDIFQVLKPFVAKNNIQVFHGKKVIELRPDIDWHKGKFARFIQAYLQRKLGHSLLPIYIGDDTTDEDAFRALKNGLTIVVGPRKNSAAMYYLKNQQQVLLFLASICDIMSLLSNMDNH